MKTRPALKAAHQDKRLLRVKRGKGWIAHEGYVAAVAKHWFALLTVQDAAPAGLVIARIADVRTLTKPHHNKVLAKRTLKAYGQWPPQVPELLDLTDVRSILFTSGSLSPVVAVARETTRPRTFCVGAVYRVTAARLETTGISPSGQWKPGAPDSFRLKDLTRVDLHDPYVEGLRKIVGPPP